MPEATRTRAGNIALALAIASSVVVAAAIVVTVVRSRARTERSRHPRVEKVETAGALVRAVDILRLEHAVDAASDGVRVTDRALAQALRLRDSDIITAISGRLVRGELDVAAALGSMFTLDPNAVYIDVVRDGKPLLLKWQVDGSMRDAVLDTQRPTVKVRKPNPYSNPNINNGLFDPFANAHAQDPLIASITKTDIDHYALPATTFHTLFDDPVTAMTNGVIASIRRVPVERDNRGVNRVFNIRPSTIWYALGLRNGDIVLGANGQTVGFTSIFDDTRHLTSASSIDLEVERAGTTMHFRYDITP